MICLSRYSHRFPKGFKPRNFGDYNIKCKSPYAPQNIQERFQKALLSKAVISRNGSLSHSYHLSMSKPTFAPHRTLSRIPWVRLDIFSTSALYPDMSFHQHLEAIIPTA
ncbi:hypothetical protein TNIN_499801 [Trichonephila inaurata madagascariensis]|uniref:Uncharacterized protein n=1 Tax=Trichonephila inaurata madagascariensis TaxID=2747483 RepID=A0A8X7BNG2_9ARAC|nr:hypothetical protein TNIN_499801 [Trichonephila inaurata madagascariensis]